MFASLTQSPKRESGLTRALREYEEKKKKESVQQEEYTKQKKEDASAASSSTGCSFAGQQIDSKYAENINIRMNERLMRYEQFTNNS